VYGFWHTLKGACVLTYPKVTFIYRGAWGFSYRKFNLVLSEDSTTPYSILHIGPFEFFIQPKSIIF
jgi:hypothetical protein